MLSYSLQLLKSEEDASYKPAKKACVQLVDNLVEHILKYEESLAGNITVFYCSKVSQLGQIQHVIKSGLTN